MVFKFFKKAMKMTKDQMDMIDGSNDPSVIDSAKRNTRIQFLVDKYKRQGYSEEESLALAENEYDN
tara:strand:- start:575 stop:772 length:198 start_codon:yes stop_codon:yes gene_type:complete